MRGSKLDLLDNGLSRRCGGLRMAIIYLANHANPR